MDSQSPLDLKHEFSGSLTRTKISGFNMMTILQENDVPKFFSRRSSWEWYVWRARKSNVLVFLVEWERPFARNIRRYYRKQYRVGV